MDILFTGSQAIESYSPITDLSGLTGNTSRNTSAERASDEYDTFSMYLYTNGGERYMDWKDEANIRLLNGSDNPYNTILGINITDIANSPAPPEADEDISDIIGSEINDDEVKKFYSDIEASLPFSVEEEKRREADFNDMYVTSSAHRYAFTEEEREDVTYDRYVNVREENISRFNSDTDSICVPVGAGELPLLMENILAALVNGSTLAEALQAQIDKYSQSESPQNAADLIWINPDSGSVTGAYAKERAVESGALEKLFDDDNAVLRLADDFASFVRYAVFASESDNPERVQEFIEHLKNKQAYADYGRYISDTDPDADIRGIMELIAANLTAAGVIGGGDTDKEPDNTDIAESGAAEETEEDNRENTETAILIPETESTPELTPKEELEEILDSIADGKGGDNAGEETAEEKIGQEFSDNAF